MLADYAGINTPAMLVLTMNDVAEANGKSVDTKKLSSKLGIPVVSMVALDKKATGTFTRLWNLLFNPEVDWMYLRWKHYMKVVSRKKSMKKR